jgi:hypothetical protein
MIRDAMLRMAATLLILGMVGCGENKLTSVTVSPAVADAKDFPGGQVQFTATGTFVVSPKPVPLKNIRWCIGRVDGWCNGFIMSAASIDGNGRAQCLPGATGTVTVLAGQGIVGNMMPDQGYKLRVFGSAQLTCP